MAQQFLDALDEIRGGTLDCEFQLPAPPAGQQLDFDRVNVELTEGADTRGLLYVENLAGCDKAELGWFYDQLPTGSSEPTKIQVCPVSCDILKSVSNGTVSIRLGCLSVRPD